LVSTGEIEDMSTTVLPTRPSVPAGLSFRPSATPWLPNSTNSTSGVSGTMMMIRSAWRATSAGVAQALAPCSSNWAGTPLRDRANSS